MQISRIVGFVRKKFADAGRWLANAFSFRKGNLLDRIFGSIVIIICLLLIGTWAVNKFILSNKSQPVVPQSGCVCEQAELTELVRSELNLLLATEYSWVFQQPTVLPGTESLVILPEEVLPDPQRYRLEDGEEAADLEAIQVLAASFERILWPIKGDIAYEYGWYRHPIYQDWRFNSGLTFLASSDEQIRSILPGRIKDIFPGEQGFEVLIEHGSGWQSLYSGIRAVTVGIGDMVQQNQFIADVGKTGELFFALFYQGEAINPMQYMSSF